MRYIRRFCNYSLSAGFCLNFYFFKLHRTGYIGYIYPPKISPSKLFMDDGVEMTSERLLDMSIKVLYIPQNFYTSPKQIYGYAPATIQLMSVI